MGTAGGCERAPRGRGSPAAAPARGGFACHGKRGGSSSPGWVVESPPLPSPPTSWLLLSPSVQREETETSLPLSKSTELNLGIAIAASDSTSRIGKTTRRLRKSGSSAAVSAMGGRGSGRRGDERIYRPTISSPRASWPADELLLPGRQGCRQCRCRAAAAITAVLALPPLC
ncbi:hypothetical protein [Oryza sativa Japonica Group]|uniref:Uncharacterized protein n=1 Tax=Oryza sativa subsp. japonica TaxID=39947 RepID=Q5ZAM1_ORYSJ|nr:hypothetical protein [Oryza sativa Japonica Group]BAD53373.1 hypothetical protein [Oryza sativa Japonica Group]